MPGSSRSRNSSCAPRHSRSAGTVAGRPLASAPAPAAPDPTASTMVTARTRPDVNAVVRARKRPQALRRNRRVRLLGLRHGHQEPRTQVGRELEHTLRLAVLPGRAQLLCVTAEQLLDVEHSLGVELGERDLGPFAAARAQRRTVEFQSAFTRR